MHPMHNMSYGPGPGGGGMPPMMQQAPPTQAPPMGMMGMHHAMHHGGPGSVPAQNVMPQQQQPMHPASAQPQLPPQHASMPVGSGTAAGMGGGGQGGQTQQPAVASTLVQQLMMHPQQVAEVDDTPKVEEEVQRLKKLIMAAVESHNLRNVFWDMEAADERGERLVVATVIDTLEKMNEKERDMTVCELVQLVTDCDEEQPAGAEEEKEQREGEGKEGVSGRQRAHRGELERLVDLLIQKAFQAQVLGANTALENLATTADFTLTTRFDGSKFRFIQQHCKEMSYKGVRALYKTLLERQVPRLPDSISAEQRRMLLPFENLILHILDRKANVFPALFGFTETFTTRGMLSKKAFLFPRVATRAAELEASFRPLAELAYISGRCFLFPLPAHPAFPTAASAWRIDATTSLIQHRAFLPYRTEMTAPQTYLLYMMIRQPRGKEHLASVMRQGRCSIDDLMAVIILEAMAEMESAPNPSAVSRYQWENIFSIFLHAIQISNQRSFARLGQLLTDTLKKTEYRAARLELMWIVLQFAGLTINHFTAENAKRVGELYSVLFSAEETVTAASDHPSQLVRVLAPACTWIMLEGKEGLPPPPSSLASQIAFIHDLQNKTDLEPAMLAVLANAFREGEVSQRVSMMLTQQLTGTAPEEAFQLAYGRVAYNKLNAFTMEFLDSLTLRSKQSLINTCMGLMRVNRAQGEKLPSPAVMETYARLLSMTEYDVGMKSFIAVVLPKAVQVAVTAQAGGWPDASEHLHMLLDIACFRLQGVSLPTPSPQGGQSARQQLLLTLISAMANQQIQHIPALYSLMEQLVLRHLVWLSLADCNALAAELLGVGPSAASVQAAKKAARTPAQPAKLPHAIQQLQMVTHMMLEPRAFSQAGMDERGPSSICPELVRMFLLNYLRMVKMTGVDMQPELVARMNGSYSWAESQLPALPQPVRETASRGEPPDSSHIDDMVIKDYAQMMGLGDQWPGYALQPERNPTLLCVLFRLMIEHRDQPIPTPVYQVLSRMTARDLILCSNMLVDYIAIHSNDSDDFFPHMVLLVNRMVFDVQLISLERLLLAAVMHPTTDHVALTMLSMIHDLCHRYPDLKERIGAMAGGAGCGMAARREHPGEHFKRVADYHRNFPEWTYTESLMHCQQMQHAASTGAPPVRKAADPQFHPPIYYGTSVERILPIVDALLVRALELSVDEVFSTLLHTFAPLYKFHPYPLTYCYSVLGYLHERIGHTARARQFALAICSGEERQTWLTEQFVNYNHQRATPQQTATELVQRFIEASDFGLAPPSFVSPDWRFAEFAPASQVLYLACIELLASPHSPQVITSALMQQVCARPLHKPYQVLNAVALILTALPPPFHLAIYQELIAIMDSPLLHEMTLDEIGFECFEESALLARSNRVVSIIALAQAFWHHSNPPTLSQFQQLFEGEMCGRVRGEPELLFVLRLLVPLLQRCYDARERKLQLEQCLELVVSVYKLVQRVSSQAPLEKEDMICDLLYHFKYLFVGDFVKTEASKVIEKMTPSMQEKLKFI